MIQEPQTQETITRPRRTRRSRGPRFAAAVALALAAVLALGAAGCGNLTAGGASEVSVEVASDETEVPTVAGSFTGSDGLGRSTAGAPPVGLGGPLEGTLSVTFALRLINSEGEEVDVTDGPQTVTLDLAAGTRAEVARSSVPAGEYDRVAVAFVAVGAEITDSPGQSQFPSQVEVDLSDGPLVVERPQAFTLSPDDRITLVLDLRSGTWLHAADPSDGRVARGILQNAVRVVIEGTD